MYVCIYWAVLENIFLKESNRQEKKLRNAVILGSLHHRQKLPASWAHSHWVEAFSVGWYLLLSSRPLVNDYLFHIWMQIHHLDPKCLDISAQTCRPGDKVNQRQVKDHEGLKDHTSSRLPCPPRLPWGLEANRSQQINSTLLPPQRLFQWAAKGVPGTFFSFINQFVVCGSYSGNFRKT